MNKKVLVAFFSILVVCFVVGCIDSDVNSSWLEYWVEITVYEESGDCALSNVKSGFETYQEAVSCIEEYKDQYPIGSWSIYRYADKMDPEIGWYPILSTETGTWGNVTIFENLSDYEKAVEKELENYTEVKPE